MHVIHQCHMVLTITEHLDILDQDHVTRILARTLERFVEHLCNLIVRIVHSFKYFLIHAGNPVGCFL